MANQRREHITKILLGIGITMGKHLENCTKDNFTFKLLLNKTVEESLFDAKNTKSDYLDRLTKLFDKLIAINVSLIDDYRPTYLTLEFGTLELHKNYVGVWYCDMETAENIKQFAIEINISSIDKLTDEEYEIIESLGLDNYIDAALDDKYATALSFAALDSIERLEKILGLNTFMRTPLDFRPYYADGRSKLATVMTVYAGAMLEHIAKTK